MTHPQVLVPHDAPPWERRLWEAANRSLIDGPTPSGLASVLRTVAHYVEQLPKSNSADGVDRASREGER